MATFKKHKMASSQPHSYGLFIGGADLQSDTETMMYCIVYGTGTYAIKTFHGAKVTTLVETEANAAIHKADANGESTNTVGWRVSNGEASCIVNGTVVKTLPRSAFIAVDRLRSTDGVYGIRASHNVEITVSNFMKH